jgi:peptidyl-dipeptidase A
MKKYIWILFLAFSVLVSCNISKEQETLSPEISIEIDAYLADYNKEFQRLLINASDAHWKSNTEIREGDTITSAITRAAGEAFAAFSGSVKNIETSQKYLELKGLSNLQKRQLETILYSAAGGPATIDSIVKEKIAASDAQNTALFGYDFKINGQTVTTNEIDRVLLESDDLEERLLYWEESKDVGKVLKSGLVDLQRLRNQSVQSLGYKNYFDYQVSDYNLSSEEMLRVCKDMIEAIWPLYRELHTFTRHTLAEKYGKDVPEMLPAHWLPNRWGQEWKGIVPATEGVDLDKVLQTKSKEWIMEKGEAFYVSMGLPELPASFYEKSSLYPLPEGADYKKNNHASAWHLDNAKDVRSLMSIEPNTRWWGTTLHELGHIYYYMAYTNENVPLILREGGNRGFHEAFGTMLGMASMQLPFLQEVGLVESDIKVDEIGLLMDEALDYAVLLPWAAGVMTFFEHELYANDLSKDEYNKKWWELKKNFQGIVPPSDRGEEYCDAASKTHINNDPAQYYDYATAQIMVYQFHKHIATKILKQDPRATNYWGNKEIGKFLTAVMAPGATQDWKELLQTHIGEDMGAGAMVEYFEPLMAHLKTVNEGRVHTLPSEPVF